MPERLLYTIGSILVRDEDPFDRTLQQVVGVLAGHFNAAQCSLMLINPDELTLEVRASTDPAIIGEKRRLSEVTVSTRALIDDAPFLADRKKLSFFRPLDARRYDSEYSLSIPLKYEDRKLGVINFTDMQGGRDDGTGEGIMSGEEQQTAMEVARHLSVYIYAAQAKSLLERKVKKYEQAVQQLKRLDELKTSLTSFIVHDLKGPITTIMANLDMLTYEPLQPGQAECVNIALQDIHKMQRMVLNILDITKLEEGKIRILREETDLAELARREIESLRAVSALRNITLGLECGPLLCYADEDLIGRTLSNLLLNALEHAPDGTKIEVGIARDAGGDTLVSVTDRGSGVPDEFKERIFDKFFQVEEGVKHGKATTGLGLTFCKLVVSAHGGRLWVEDAPGGGARFLFSLPEPLTHERFKEEAV